MAAGEGESGFGGDFHRTGVLHPDVGGALDGVATGLELGQVNGLPAHRLIDGLVLKVSAAWVLHGGKDTTGIIGGVLVLALRAEGLADGRGGLELPRTDSIHRHAGSGQGEEVGDILSEVVGHLDAHGMDARRSHRELKAAGLRIVLPHAHVRGVLDAVDRNAVDGATGHGVKRLIVRRKGHLGGGCGDGNGGLALGCHVSANVGGRAVEVEGGLGGRVGRGVDELDTGRGHHGLALVIQLRVGLGDIDQTGRIVHDEAVAHPRIGIVVGRTPIGELGTGDVCTSPTDIVVGIGVNLEEDGVGDGLREHGRPVVGHTVAIVVSPERIERAVGQHVTVHDGRGDGEDICSGEVVALSHILRVCVVANIVLDAGDGLALIDIHRLECGGADRAVLIEGGGHDGVTLHGEGCLAVLDIDGDTILVASEHGEAVSEVPLIRGDFHGDIGADLDRHRHIVAIIEGELAVLRFRKGDRRKLRFGGIGHGRDSRVQDGARDEHR